MNRNDTYAIRPDGIVSSLLNRTSSILTSLLALLLLTMAAPVHAALTINDITWGVKGLDSNDVLTGPNQYPVGARVCSEVGDAASTATVTFNWDDGPDKYYPSDPYINLRANTLDVITLDVPANGGCKDAYFEVEITRDSNAYDKTRGFTVTADDGSTSDTTPSPREVYVEHLISQSRNAVTDMQLSTDGTTYTSVDAGDTMTLVVGETYHIKMVATTATQGYEQLESFINFPNIIFQTLSVSTDYSAASGGGVDPSDTLYGDACTWDANADPANDNYLSCLLDGKVGGDIVTIYEVKILEIPGAPLVNPQPLSTLIHDFSGSSFHYNADFSTSVRYAHIIGSTIEKSFSPKDIKPLDPATLTFTITNPKSTAITDVNFVDNFPSGLAIEGTAIDYTGCGGSESPAVLVNGQTSLSFTGIEIVGYGTCTIEVTVTSDTDGIYENETGNLFIGTFDTLSKATDTLVVTSLPPPPSACSNPTLLASWTIPDGTTAPPPFSTKDLDVSYATTSFTSNNGGVQSINTAGNPTSAWGGTSITGSGWNETAATSNTYFQFDIDTSNFGGVTISLDVSPFSQGNWANPQSNILIKSSANGGAFTTYETSPGVYPQANKGNWNTFSLIPAATTGTASTTFRISADSAQKDAATLLLDNIQIFGCPRQDPPTMNKSFGPDSVGIGGISTLTFGIQNPIANASELVDVSFSDALPTGIVVADTPSVTFVGCTPGSITSPAIPTDSITADANTGLIEMTGVTLSPGADCSFTVNVKGVVDGSYLNTTTSITSLYTGPNTSGVPNQAFGQDTIIVTPTPHISKSFGASAILTGGTTTLAFSITNTSIGGTPLTGVGFSDPMPLGVSVVTADGVTGSCPGGSFTLAAGSVSMSGATLAPGSSCSFSVNVQGTTAGLKTNTTSVVTSVEGDGNTATANLLVKAPSPEISLIKQVGLTANGPWTNFVAVAPGGAVYYRFLIENTGDVDLTGVDISDPDLDGLPTTTANCIWADGDGNPLASLYTLRIPDVDERHIGICVLGPYTAAGSGLINTATTANASGAVNVSDTAEYATTDLSLDKSVTSGDPFSDIGDTITYSYLVTNTGAAGLTGDVTVADNKTAVSCPTGDLVAGASLLCTASYTVTATDVSNGFVTNIATATIANGGNPVVSNSDTVTVYPAPTAVTIGKVELEAVQVRDFLASLGLDGSSRDALLAMLAAWNSELAASLADADIQTLLDALADYLDPDGDGQTAVIRWDTLEERGTIGFYVERSEADDEWLRINDDMLPGLITAPMGGEYQLVDPSAETGVTYQYLLIEQEARGTTQTYGPYMLEIN